MDEHQDLYKDDDSSQNYHPPSGAEEHLHLSRRFAARRTTTPNASQRAGRPQAQVALCLSRVQVGCTDTRWNDLTTWATSSDRRSVMKFKQSYALPRVFARDEIHAAKTKAPSRDIALFRSRLDFRLQGNIASHPTIVSAVREKPQRQHLSPMARQKREDWTCFAVPRPEDRIVDFQAPHFTSLVCIDDTTRTALVTLIDSARHPSSQDIESHSIGC